MGEILEGGQQLPEVLLGPGGRRLRGGSGEHWHGADPLIREREIR